MEKPKPLLDLRDFGVDLRVNFRRRVFALVERFQAKKTVPVFGVLVNCSALSPGKATA